MEDTDENIELILAQWQTCVEMANTVSQRRDAMNNIFITLNLAIITAVSVTWELKSLLVLTAGIVTCVLWHFFIRNYKELNTEKFRVINTLEGKLPVKPFHDEWNRLKEKIKAGDIILSHNGTKHTADSLDMIIKNIKAKGLEVVRISDLIYQENYTINNNGTQIQSK